MNQVATSFLFQLVSRRYTKGSIIITSNKSYGEWGSVFGDEFAEHITEVLDGSVAGQDGGAAFVTAAEDFEQVLDGSRRYRVFRSR